MAVSVATFTKDTLLDECADFAVTLPIGEDAGGTVDALTQAAQPKKGSKAIQIYKLCTEQYRTNPVLATCTVHVSQQASKSDAGLEPGFYAIDITSRYYNLDQITHDDVYMKQCLEMKGGWQAAEHDSEEYREALRARARREVEKAQNALGNLGRN